MNAYFKGNPVFGPRGPAGPDGTPLGTVISFLGPHAPADYLPCDGAEHPVADYPDLAAFFAEQFGSANHFGGDGTTTFAVPDLRNLFLRGFHGEAEEQLSGEIGERQEATEHLNLYSLHSGHNFSVGIIKESNSYNLLSSNEDSRISESSVARIIVGDLTTSDASANDIQPCEKITSRPVNMAVLYCIKAVASASAESVYSTEETRIGTWADGKPLYRKVIYLNLPNQVRNHATYSGVDLPENSVLVKYEGLCETTSGAKIALYAAGYSYVSFDGEQILVWAPIEKFVSAKVTLIVEYTKTTDLAAEEI